MLGNVSRSKTKEFPLKHKKAQGSGVKKAANVFWLIFVGIWLALSEILIGAALCCTLIFIPFGIQHFKLLKLVPKPFGRDVIRRFKAHPFMNIIYLIFGGLELAIVQAVLALVFYITIVGIPVATQIMKFASYNLAPFGAEIVLDNKLTDNKDTAHDFVTLLNRVNEDPNRVISTPDKGNMKASEYLTDLAYNDDDINKAFKKSIRIRNILIPIFIIMFFALYAVCCVVVLLLLPENTPATLPLVILLVPTYLFMFIAYFVFADNLINGPYFYKDSLKKVLFLKDIYTDDSDYAVIKNSKDKQHYPVKFYMDAKRGEKQRKEEAKKQKEQQN